MPENSSAAPQSGLSEDAKAKLAAALGGSVGAAGEEPAAKASGSAAKTKAAEAPAEEAGVAAGLARIIEAASGLPLEEITPDARIEEDLAIDSLSRIDIITQAEDKFGVRIDEMDLQASMTVKEFAELIEARRAGN
ncbi:acyl carrier protein [Corynebacterium sp. UMB9976]|uniref:acyl carrier protein n=1 Tax=Corynebacterium sp. UMB9976 TaxID=3046354 RepID=UPI00254B41F7|nr:acyl carrier protein [Corynebacterium sp. UMB9976]MDK6301436.1 acyl carrier protein [Corynebacterium sp. UMB9976]